MPAFFGAYIRAGGLTAEKSSDLNKILPKIVGDSPDKLYDMAAIKAVLGNPKFVNNTPMTAPVYNREIDSMWPHHSRFLLLPCLPKSCPG